MFAVESQDAVPKGPYIAHVAGSDITLGPVYRVYYDEYQAFMSGILPNGTGGAYRYAATNTLSDATVGIPVPSRLYGANATTESQPFKGLRVTVKDIIDVEGVKTSNGNRAWFKLYDAPNATAPAVQRLVDMGAVLIGKTKTAQFANADRVTADWVDYQ
jgi:Asp-tRNA(Asn)/Glu-tRNA(Gln) amidotransferase A subunit family amidase